MHRDRPSPLESRKKINDTPHSHSHRVDNCFGHPVNSVSSSTIMTAQQKFRQSGEQIVFAARRTPSNLFSLHDLFHARAALFHIAACKLFD